jgi:hypothetical protein
MPQEPRAWSRSPWIVAAILQSDAPTSQAPTTPGSEPSSGPTKVPPPGSLDPVPIGDVKTAPPVDLDETGDFETGLTLRIVEMNAVDGVARGPGEISGPALQLVMDARNDSGKPVSLEGMVVALDYGAAHTPAGTLMEPGGAPFEGVVKAGDTAHGVYVFAIPEADRDRITVTASYTGRAPTLIFRGDAG